MEKSKIPVIGGIVTAIVASLCCIGPAVLALVGAGSIGAFAAFEPYRPYFVGITVAILGLAFYLTYRKREVKCEDGTCKVEGASKWNKISAWLATFFAVVAIGYPYLGAASPPSFNAAVNPSATALVKIEGMDCSACAVGIQSSLASMKGVHEAKVVYKTGLATIHYDPSLVQPTDFVKRIGQTGYKAEITRQNRKSNAHGNKT